MYPEDRGELYGEINEEEASFYFALNDFDKLIERYGAHFVLSRMRKDTFQKLSQWFYHEEKQEVCALLKETKTNG